MRSKLFLIAMGAAITYSCSDNNVFSGNEYEPVALSRAQEEVADGMFRFTMDLLRTAHELYPDENVVLSPLGAAMVSGMIVNAQSPENRDELLDILKIGDGGVDDLNSYASLVMEKLPALDKQSILKMGNIVWSQSRHNPASNYGETVGENYRATFMSQERWVDAISPIDLWASQITDGAIESFGNTNDERYHFWGNVLYYKGYWTNRFDKSKTSKKPFETSRGTSEKVDMMFGEIAACINFEADNSNDYFKMICAVTIPFGNSAFCFTGILPPDENHDINQVFELFTQEILHRSNSYMDRIDKIESKNKSKIYLPKMKFIMNTDVKEIMQGMGVEKLFEDFTFNTLCDANDENESGINEFSQSINFELDEEGTEIKVSTKASAGIGAASPTFVEFNRPFVYLVWERSTGAVLLAGIYNHP